MNIKDKLSKLNKDCYLLLQDIGKTAEAEKQKAYLVGGMVRDLLLGYDNLDIDIVVEPNATALADALVKRFPHCELSAKHDRFHTAKLIFTVNGKKIPIDLASTREEIYEQPAALPKVRVSDLKKDLYRRDFTINALAVSLIQDEFGEVVDLFDGLLDLRNKKIRVLHDLSFIDDPTRMIRAIRFACKLGFEIEEYTQKLLKEAISSGQFNNLIEKIRGDRVKIEIRYLFNLPNIEDAIKSFFEAGIYRMIDMSLRGGDKVTDEAIPIVSWKKIVSVVSLPRNDSEKQWLIYLALIMKNLNSQFQEKIMKNLQMTSEEIKIIKSGFTAHNRLQTLIENNQKIDSIIIYRELKELDIESILIVKLAISPQQSAVSTFVDEFLEKTSKIRLEITGDDLITLGVKQGKQIGEILDKVLEKKINNPQMKKEDELREAKKSLEGFLEQ